MGRSTLRLVGLYGVESLRPESLYVACRAVCLEASALPLGHASLMFLMKSLVILKVMGMVKVRDRSECGRDQTEGESKIDLRKTPFPCFAATHRLRKIARGYRNTQHHS
jgi:hypothetical protein